MDIECPHCKKVMELDCGDLPDHACDSSEVECVNCEENFTAGWYATAELR